MLPRAEVSTVLAANRFCRPPSEESASGHADVSVPVDGYSPVCLLFAPVVVFGPFISA